MARSRAYGLRGVHKPGIAALLRADAATTGGSPPMAPGAPPRLAVA